MTAYLDRQYNPPSGVILANRATSVRTVRDLADGINNYKRRAGVIKYRSLMFPSGVYSADNSTTEYLALPPMAPIEVARGYENLLWVIRHQLTALSGDAAYTRWKLYANAKLYRGPEALNSALLYLARSSYIDSDALAPGFGREYTSLLLVRGASNLVHCLLTAANSDTGTRARITSLDVYGVP